MVVLVARPVCGGAFCCKIILSLRDHRPFRTSEYVILITIGSIDTQCLSQQKFSCRELCTNFFWVWRHLLVLLISCFGIHFADTPGKWRISHNVAHRTTTYFKTSSISSRIMRRCSFTNASTAEMDSDVTTRFDPT